MSIRAAWPDPAPGPAWPGELRVEPGTTLLLVDSSCQSTGCTASPSPSPRVAFVLGQPDIAWPYMHSRATRSLHHALVWSQTR
jgi:hypothetical protein